MSVHDEALGAAAISVLAEQGGRAFTHRAVDRRAGVPEGTASRYARTRAALLELAAVATFNADRLEALEALLGDGTAITTPAAVAGLLMRATTALLRAPERFRARVELQLEAERLPALRRHLQRYRAEFVAPVARVLNDIGYEEPLAFAEMLLTVVDGIMYRQLVSGFAPLDDDQIRQILATAVTPREVARPSRDPHRR
jgi:DNA-binding transcriptional regulator YbjK